jgi:tetratricopeptide (TPR) repeat protein
LLDLSDEFLFIDNDSSVKYAREAIEISEKHHLLSREYGGRCMLCIALSLSGNYSPALESGMKALAIAESLHDTFMIAWANITLMNSYLLQEDYKQALKYGTRAELLSRSPKVDMRIRSFIKGILGAVYQHNDKLDSELYYCLDAYDYISKNNIEWGGIYRHTGDIYFKKGDE